MSDTNRQPVPLGLKASFGFGDRIGLATPGHVAALKRAGDGIAPIFAQQSIREMARTQRLPEQVMADALKGAADAGFSGPQGADADHLKTPQDVERTAAARFCFFTIDPSEHVDGYADGYDASTLQEKFALLREKIDWITQYQGKSVTLNSGTKIEFTESICKKAAVKYGRAITFAIDLAKHIHKTMSIAQRDYEIELSVDETPQPTTPAEHYIIAEQCLAGGMKLVSLAPRFVGEFEKGVDFKGDRAAFERSLADHAAIAKQIGPYKLSLHSGSDKLSIYASFAKATAGMFHVKTAGTSYLEALRVVARHDETLFRKIIDFARSRYDTDKATYHVSATLADAPPPADIRSSRDLEQLYLGEWASIPEGFGFTQPGRQILHCTFGSVLTTPEYRDKVMALLKDNQPTYTELLAEHFEMHLRALKRGM